MGLDASVRCRCFEERRLRPGPIPYGDLYIDEEGYLSSRGLDEARAKYDYRQFEARYGQIEREFDEWLDDACEHEFGDMCSERVGNWSGVAMFEHWCKVIGEDRLPTLSHMLPDGNGGTFPAERAREALAELDVFDTELDAIMVGDPTYTLVDCSTGKEVWSEEDGALDIYPIAVFRISRAAMVDGEFRIVDDDQHKGETYFSSRHFTQKRVDPAWEGTTQPRYDLTCLDTGTSFSIFDGIGLGYDGDAEFSVGTRKAWPGTFANTALRRLLMASIETGNPIRWC